MANATTPFGLRPVRHLNGAPWNGQTIRAYCDASYGTALFIGDPVTITPTAADRSLTNKYYSLAVATAGEGNMVKGVIVSFEPDPDNLTLKYRAASTERWANIVIPTPDLIFQIRDDGTSSVLDFATGLKGAGSNSDLAAGSGGSTVTGLSSWALDASDVSAEQDFQLYIVGLADIPDNEGDDYAIWDVILNTCYNKTGLILGVTAA